MSNMSNDDVVVVCTKCGCTKLVWETVCKNCGSVTIKN
jgi:hypothetical protein|tara:strand:- start:916 stop:1029 length:114 start_codon:yes stop_codon:yes gene_type:complete